jgi:hypothetical protein
VPGPSHGDVTSRTRGLLEGASRALARTAALSTGLKWSIMAFARSTNPWDCVLGNLGQVATFLGLFQLSSAVGSGQPAHPRFECSVVIAHSFRKSRDPNSPSGRPYQATAGRRPLSGARIFRSGRPPRGPGLHAPPRASPHPVCRVISHSKTPILGTFRSLEAHTGPLIVSRRQRGSLLGGEEHAYLWQGVNSIVQRSGRLSRKPVDVYSALHCAYCEFDAGVF